MQAFLFNIIEQCSSIIYSREEQILLKFNTNNSLINYLTKDNLLKQIGDCA
jgi:hypothetical protein